MMPSQKVILWILNIFLFNECGLKPHLMLHASYCEDKLLREQRQQQESIAEEGPLVIPPPPTYRPPPPPPVPGAGEPAPLVSLSASAPLPPASASQLVTQPQPTAPAPAHGYSKVRLATDCFSFSRHLFWYCKFKSSSCKWVKRCEKAADMREWAHVAKTKTRLTTSGRVIDLQLRLSSVICNMQIACELWCIRAWRFSLLAASM